MIQGKSPEKIKQVLLGSAGDFTQYVEEYIRSFDEVRGFWEARKFETVLRKCQAFWGKEISWKLITSEALVRIERYMRSDIGNGANTVRKELERIHRLFRIAIREGLVMPGNDPFIQYRMPKGEKVEKRKLSLAEIRALADVDSGVPGHPIRPSLCTRPFCSPTRSR